jgi:hypothetical protein
MRVHRSRTLSLAATLVGLLATAATGSRRTATCTRTTSPRVRWKCRRTSIARTDAAMKMPPTASATARRRAAVGTGSTPLGFTVPGERDAVFAKVGDALAATEGVTVASRAQLLGTYDVSYEGSDFLVRVTKVDAGVYISAVDPRGLPAAGDAPHEADRLAEDRAGRLSHAPASLRNEKGRLGARFPVATTDRAVTAPAAATCPACLPTPSHPAARPCAP